MIAVLDRVRPCLSVYLANQRVLCGIKESGILECHCSTAKDRTTTSLHAVSASLLSNAKRNRMHAVPVASQSAIRLCFVHSAAQQRILRALASSSSLDSVSCGYVYLFKAGTSPAAWMPAVWDGRWMHAFSQVPCVSRFSWLSRSPSRNPTFAARHCTFKHFMSGSSW